MTKTWKLRIGLSSNACSSSSIQLASFSELLKISLQCLYLMHSDLNPDLYLNFDLSSALVGGAVSGDLKQELNPVPVGTLRCQFLLR